MNKENESVREWRERCTLPVEIKWFHIDLWINGSWFRISTRYERAEDAERQAKHYKMPTPLRIVECRQIETEVYRKDSPIKEWNR